MTNEKKKIRCAIYTRKIMEYSMDKQRLAGELYIKANENWELIQKHYDGDDCSEESDKNIERPGLKELLDDITAGLIDQVVVYNVECLALSPSTFAAIIELFDRHDVVLACVPQEFDTSTPMGKLILKTLSTLTQYEKELGEEMALELQEEGE